VKGLVVHDILLSVFVVTGTFVSPVQMYLWAGVELLLTVLLLKFRVFKDKLMHIRQITMCNIFFSLSIFMGAVGSNKNNSPDVSIALFFIYLVILSIEAILIFTLYAKGIISLVKKNKTIVEDDKVKVRDGQVAPLQNAPNKVKIIQKKLLVNNPIKQKGENGQEYGLPEDSPQIKGDNQVQLDHEDFILSANPTTRISPDPHLENESSPIQSPEINKLVNNSGPKNNPNPTKISKNKPEAASKILKASGNSQSTTLLNSGIQKLSQH